MWVDLKLSLSVKKTCRFWLIKSCEETQQNPRCKDVNWQMVWKHSNRKQIMGKWEALLQFALFRQGYLLTTLTFLAEVLFFFFLCFNVNLYILFFLILLPFLYFFPANFPDSVVENLPADISTGIYYGWARLSHGDVYKMVMSIGWNPYYKNTKKSMVSSWTCR